MNAFIERHGLTFSSVNDGPGDVFARFGVSGQPAWVFVDAAGGTKRVLGSLSGSQLDELIREIA